MFVVLEKQRIHFWPRKSHNLPVAKLKILNEFRNMLSDQLTLRIMPRQPHMPYKIAPIIISRANHGEETEQFGSGEQILNFVTKRGSFATSPACVEEDWILPPIHPQSNRNREHVAD